MKRKIVMMVLVASLVMTACGDKTADDESGLGAITIGGETIAVETQEDPWSNPGGEIGEDGIVYPTSREALTDAEMYMDELYGKNQTYYQDLYDGQLLKVGSKYHIVPNYVKQLVGGEEATIENHDMKSVVAVGDKAVIAYNDSHVEIGDGEGVARFLRSFQAVLSEEMGDISDLDAEIHACTIPDDNDRVHFCIEMPKDEDGNMTLMVLQDVAYETYMSVQITDKTGKVDWGSIVDSYMLPSFNE